jgi:hypothetical protein
MLASCTISTLTLLLVGFFSLPFGSKAQQAATGKEPADAGRALRLMMLTMGPEKNGQTPTKEFPRIYGVLMDWPIEGQIATVFSTSTGAASLYTTSTFGIIGGEAHETIRTAATKFVRAADRYFDSSTPTTDYPYPTTEQIRFYFLTFNGVRVIDADLASATISSDTYAELFRRGQAVLTELRRVSEDHR